MSRLFTEVTVVTVMDLSRRCEPEIASAMVAYLQGQIVSDFMPIVEQIKACRYSRVDVSAVLDIVLESTRRLYPPEWREVNFFVRDPTSVGIIGETQDPSVVAEPDQITIPRVVMERIRRYPELCSRILRSLLDLPGGRFSWPAESEA